VFGSWDGEEYNLQGSTAWGEEHADELVRQAIAYVNVVCPWLAVERRTRCPILWCTLCVCQAVQGSDSDHVFRLRTAASRGRRGLPSPRPPASTPSGGQSWRVWAA
jgi:hypothetical protein